MPATILTGAAASGKTALVIDEILRIEDIGKEVWVLLPTRLQIDAFRDRLMQKADAVFNVRFFNFYELYNLLLDMAGDPQRTLYQAASDRILNQIIHQLLRDGQIQYYRQIADKAGFIQLADRFIKELKQGLIETENFADFAKRSTAPKDHDLALIYRYYQDFLRHHDLVDRDGAGWLALAHLRTNIRLVEKVMDIGLLVVDGYDSFTPLQAKLLAELVHHISNSVLTLTHEESRKDGAHRIFDMTLNRLLEKGYSQKTTWNIETHDGGKSQKPPALRHLERQLFTPMPLAMPSDGVLKCIEAPNPQTEARAVMREIKKLLLEGVRADKILVVMRSADPYADALRGAATAYQMPVIVRQADSVLQNPAVAGILQLLDLHSFDFPRRQLLDLLRNPYLDVPYFTAENRNDLELLSLKLPIVKGRENWLNGLAVGKIRNEDNEIIFQTDGQALAYRAEAFFNAITPAPTATARDYIRWIQTLLGTDPILEAEQADDSPDTPLTNAVDHFAVYGQIREQGEGAVMVRDLHAMHAFRSALQEVLSAYDLLAETTNAGQAELVEWDSFRADLELVLQNRRMENDLQSRVGRVLVTTIFEARGLSHDHVFIVGLSEGIFPAQQQEDPLYSNLERTIMTQVHKLDLQTAEERAVDSGLFYEMCALADQTLTLSRPAIDEKGNAWPESIFWKAVTTILEGAPVTRYRLGEVNAPAESANQREMLVSLSGALRQFPDEISEETWEMARGLQNHPLWRNVLRGRKIETDRESPRVPFDGYTGILTDPYFIEMATQKLMGRMWSATQLNELGQCRFRFFSKRLLKLEPYVEPEEGMDVMQLGSLNHKILEETYNRLDGYFITAENQELALQILREVATEVLDSAPQKFGFQATALWEQEKQSLLDKLERIVSTDFSPISPLNKLGSNRRPFKQEAAFGEKHGNPTFIDGTSIRVNGFIDRMDLSDEGLIVMDYKSGKTPTNKEMLEGRNFQMMLYLMAAQQLLEQWNLPHEVRGGLFWSINQNKEGGMIEVGAEEVEIARQKIQEHIAAAQAGNFANLPSKLEDGKCARYCEFHQFCRMNRASTRKPS